MFHHDAWSLKKKNDVEVFKKKCKRDTWFGFVNSKIRCYNMAPPARTLVQIKNNVNKVSCEFFIHFLAALS
jgi:hypothetical protein